MTKLINIKIARILSPSQMAVVKGGGNDKDKDKDKDNKCGAVEDDKRRDRPGGGITTL